MFVVANPGTLQLLGMIVVVQGKDHSNKNIMHSIQKQLSQLQKKVIKQ